MPIPTIAADHRRADGWFRVMTFSVARGFKAACAGNHRTIPANPVPVDKARAAQGDCASAIVSITVRAIDSIACAQGGGSKRSRPSVSALGITIGYHDNANRGAVVAE